MASLARHRLTPAETGPALRALCEWTPADVPGGGLHPGDVGWYLRFDDAAVFLWTDDAAPVTGGFLDGPVLRVTAAPGAGPGTLAALAADAEEFARARSPSRGAQGPSCPRHRRPPRPGRINVSSPDEV
ncbi:hypothetical protein [Streptomyces sp. NPDC058625]|uniref:hypothetical protein n=1 Tax=Streptomyces sp. NPDC058625 TaxID=3346564 RepID=UPI003662D92C